MGAIAGVAAAGVVLWASWYGPGYEGRATASGEPFRADRLTCASWDYPFGTVLRVTCEDSGKSVEVTVNDRGPAKHLSAKLDLSPAAFVHIAPLTRGLILVRVEIMSQQGGKVKAPVPR